MKKSAKFSFLSWPVYLLILIQMAGNPALLLASDRLSFESLAQPEVSVNSVITASLDQKPRLEASLGVLSKVEPNALYSIRARNLSASSATIQWTTPLVSDSQVEYGTTVSLGQFSEKDASLDFKHVLKMDHLSAGTTYRGSVLHL